ncbi:unnamed protein product [Rhizoctonia solani]|uniref:CHAT domain-containing protein n=1 Tax=Rhizoctonia solani TaxID=456999 RepID=A0A8H2Y543_9AGAM|nr:unnamed protein product [Rhizoctonia solani]
MGQQRRRLAREYQDLLAQARQLPEFEDFLWPIKANNLTSAARNGPVAVINCHTDRCDALLILPGHTDITHIPLTEFTKEKARTSRIQLEKSLRLRQLRERGVKPLWQPQYKDHTKSVLAALWTHIVKPVLDALGYTNNLLSNNLPHITWCPTGALSFLPLHAAGDYSQPQERVFNYVISSYTPTVTALITSTLTTLNDDCCVLAIGQAVTPGHTPLPGTLKELACVESHMQGKAEYSQLMDYQATTRATLDAMEHHDWIHLACHAHQNVADPTKSGFFLHDGTLDLASINWRSFKSKGLAFLSACQTATGDERLPDEAIHLALGMLMAGYQSVIATMWSVHDDNAPIVAEKVYAQLMRDGKIGNGEAGEALHYAVAELREKVGEKKFGRWAPYIHIGS